MAEDAMPIESVVINDQELNIEMDAVLEELSARGLNTNGDNRLDSSDGITDARIADQLASAYRKVLKECQCPTSAGLQRLIRGQLFLELAKLLNEGTALAGHLQNLAKLAPPGWLTLSPGIEFEAPNSEKYQQALKYVEDNQMKDMFSKYLGSLEQLWKKYFGYEILNPGSSENIQGAIFLEDMPQSAKSAVDQIIRNNIKILEAVGLEKIRQRWHVILDVECDADIFSYDLCSLGSLFSAGVTITVGANIN